jgi:hypothetical protein
VKDLGPSLGRGVRNLSIECQRAPINQAKV